MKVLFLYIVFCIGILSSVKAQDEVRFFKGSYKDLTQQASKQEKIYILFFTKENCQPCERMKTETFTDPTLAELMTEKSLIYKAQLPDFDAYALAEEYHIVGYPTMLLFSPEGKLLGTLVGGQSASTLTNYLRSIM